MRKLAAATLVVLIVIVNAAPAGADPAAPTNYLSEVVAIAPAIDGLKVSIVAGDAFVRLVAEDLDVTVLGYRGEPYLHFSSDGTVRENRRSPAVDLNRNRFGTGGGGDPDAEPDWRVVARDGSYVWHDHRTHWMPRSPPLGRSPGDRILEGVVPLVVDGQRVDVEVIGVWLHPPSRLPALLGATSAIALALTAWRTVGSRWRAGLVLVAGAAAALVGVWQHLSLPDGTRPSLLGWLLPGLAVLAAGSSLFTRDRLVASALVAFAAVELGVWAWMRRTVLSRALIPTDAPAGLDRAVTAGTAVVAVLVALAVVADRRRGSA